MQPNANSVLVVYGAKTGVPYVKHKSIATDLAQQKVDLHFAIKTAQSYADTLKQPISLFWSGHYMKVQPQRKTLW